jgi:hypothetical protein
LLDTARPRRNRTSATRSRGGIGKTIQQNRNSLPAPPNCVTICPHQASESLGTKPVINIYLYQARKKGVAMKRQILAVILAGPLLFGLPILQTLRGQTCSDDEGMVKSYVQGINSLVETVQKENLSDFEKDYHEQSCLSRINLSIGIVNSLIACLNKAAKDPADTPAQTAAIQSKLQTYAKLESALEQDRDSLKAAKNPKAAKSIIEMFVLTV